jgi:hypothetical protein
MQRNITYQDVVRSLLYLLLFVVYESLSSIYLLLPPLFAIIFFYFVKNLDELNYLNLFLLIMMLLFYEATKGFFLFTSIIYFFFVYYFIIPKIVQYVNCKGCLGLIYATLAYFGYWIFTLLVAQIFWLELPSVDWYIFYYIFLEFLIITLA